MVRKKYRPAEKPETNQPKAEKPEANEPKAEKPKPEKARRRIFHC